MKTKILPFLFVLIGGLFIATSAFAQPSTPTSTIPATALDGSTQTYSVNALTGATYHWILSGGSNTNDLPSQLSGALNDNSVSITWDNAEPGTTYNLDVYVVDANGCYSEMKRTAITINKATIDLVAAQTATTCSFLAGSNIKGNSTTPANDIFTINATSDGGITPATIDYEIYDGTTLKDTRTTTVALLTGTFNVSLDGIFANTTSNNKTFTIKLKSAKDSKDNLMIVGTTTATITILPIPVITFN